MIARLPLLAPLLRQAFEAKPGIPLHAWASQNVFLDRRITARPGFYDDTLFPWTWAFMEIARHRKVYEKDGVIVDEPGEGVSVSPVRQISVMKCSQSGFTEAALNLIRYAARHDPQNTIYAIDSRSEAATINEIRLQGTLRRLGQDIFSQDSDDVSQFVLKLRRMLIYFVGSFSAAAFANKSAQLVIADELDEHGQPTDDTNNVDNLRSRVKSAQRGLLVLLSKPKLAGGPIHSEHSKGSRHVPEVTCPHCGEWQELIQENLIFGHCKNLLGQWDLERVMRETYFKCAHCAQPIEETAKNEWRYNPAARRWRRTNQLAEPGHISFQISDFLSYMPGATWGQLACEYIQGKGDHRARQGYRNNHEGLPWDVTGAAPKPADILRLCSDYERGTIPWKPDALLLGADVGAAYAKWVIVAGRRTSNYQAEFAVIDWGTELSPDDLLTVLSTKHYRCVVDNQECWCTLGLVDSKYRKNDVHHVCLRSNRALWPSQGSPATFALRSVAFNSLPPPYPPGFGTIVYIDRDAKFELYVDRMSAWLRYDPTRDEEPPPVPQMLFPAGLTANDQLIVEHSNEVLIEKSIDAHSAKSHEWQKIGPNHYGDCTKVALVLWRYKTSLEPTAAEARIYRLRNTSLTPEIIP